MKRAVGEDERRAVEGTAVEEGGGMYASDGEVENTSGTALGE